MEEFYRASEHVRPDASCVIIGTAGKKMPCMLARTAAASSYSAELAKQLKAPPGRTRSSKSQGDCHEDLQGMNALIFACLVPLANIEQHLVIIPQYLYLGVYVGV